MERLQYWVDFVNSHGIRAMAEIGVWRGQFAEELLSRCHALERYYMIDPWRKLGDWNKPLNEDDLADALEETRRRLAPIEEKCVYLREKTSDGAGELPELDFAYFDGDHTLRGIVVDMLKV